jgi:phosphatidate cytidylyltransferase
MTIFKDWSNLQLRLATGILGAGVFAGLLFAGPGGSLFLFAGLIFLCNLEFLQISPHPFSRSTSMMYAGIASLAFIGIIQADSTRIPVYPLLLMLPAVIVASAVFASYEKPMERAAWVLFGFLYLGLPWFCFYSMLKNQQYDPLLFLGLFGLLWMADSGAYFAGKTLGKTKLLPSVSPKKTVEGLAGGLLASLFLAWILARYLPQFSAIQWMILACSTTLAGTMGDLAESRLKRSLDLKDSGSLLPGHGGFLDRFDGFFLSSPVNYLIISYFF